jgi:enolase
MADRTVMHPLPFRNLWSCPVKAKNFTHAMQMGTEIFHNLKKVLHGRNLSTAVGDEGGFAPTLDGTEDALDTIAIAVKNAGYSLGDEVMIAFRLCFCRILCEWQIRLFQI